MHTRFVTLSFAVSSAIAAAALSGPGGAHAAVAALKAPPPSASGAASPSDALAQEGAPATPGTPQRSKMKACNADAKSKDLHGDERRKFMSHCLSGKAPPVHS